ncbi:hypothetical protein FAUST_8743 [Fusarium austroamericanum]|uniref:Zn(2)-C6 fungal-type domain-containing protein n=1 Tax=Fusarium austroamericanum TaxID=282268 RepID=A0AAN5Z4E9_FUSAU|nr:hypothetical protein FAUST_8743 [Fusarium austroamericanum]
MAISSTSSSPSVKPTGIATLACTVCRKQHLKCDAGKPSCSRCTETNQVCFYEPSRRGGRRKKHRSSILETQPKRLMMRSSHSEQPSTTGFVESVIVNPISLPITPTSSSQETLPSSGLTQDAISSNGLPQLTRRQTHQSSVSESSHSDRRASDHQTQGPASVQQPSNDPAMAFYHHLDPGLISQAIESTNLGMNTQAPIQPSSDNDRLLRLYYENFHNAHPFLVPSSVFTSRNYPPYLRRMVDFAGSHYAPSGPNAQLRAAVTADMLSMTDNSTCMVQSLLIYSILLFFGGDFDAAGKTFGQCTRMAMDLGMHLNDFAAARQLDNPIEAESLRRTWWEIYVTDILMAIPPKTMNLGCSSVPPKVCLPCEEAFYTGRLDIPQPHHVLEFKRRVLSTGDVTFSSFSYRIEAATILGRVLLLNQLKNSSYDHSQSIENALLSWSNHLPPGKLEIVDSYGNIDEMMFQAHMIIALASMLLHLPRSNLHSLLADSKDPFLPIAQNHPLSSSTTLIQGIKATDASRRISDCISLCPNVPKHTPFVIPALALCGFIQLATSQGHPDECFEHHYNRVTLVLGCLKSARRIWPMAESEYDRLRCCASDLIADAMDRMNALPLCQTLPNNSPAMSGAADQGGDLTLVSPTRGNVDSGMPRLDMTKFQYRRLDEAANEIRVITIWPGRFDDPIKIDITQCSFIPPPVQSDSGLLSLDEINKTLSDDSPWEAFNTLESRILFINDDTGETSWRHPDPLVDPCLYDRESIQMHAALPAYEALSYTWGDQDPASTVAVQSINNLNEEPEHLHQGFLTIGENLDEALRHLRYPHRPRTMWIDALCINQSDVEERNHEVKRMGDIFRLATRVVAWIGPAYEGSTLALAMMRDISQHVVWKSSGACKPRPGCSDHSWHNFSIPLRLNKIVEIAIANLFSRSWFRRLWVLQEIHLSSPSSVIQYSHETILWTDLQGTAMVLFSKHDDKTAGRLRRHLWEMSRICFYSKGIKLDDLLWKYHDLGCQLPHDRIYGLMNLAPKGWSNRIEPDYSLPILDVYRDAFMAYTHHYGRLDLLPRTGDNGAGTLSSDEHWPSWVPDWTARVLDTVPPANGFNAASFSPSHTVLHSPNELEVAGVRLGSVTHTYRFEVSSFKGLAEYLNELGLEKIMEKEYLPGETVLDAYLHVLAHSRFKDRYPASGCPTLEQFREHILDLAQGRESQYDLTQYESNVIVGWQDSYCFVTSDGYLGHCRTRGTIQLGDQVFIPLGCQIPILTRPTADNKHRSLGDCFVHGIMNGEALLGPLPSNYSAQQRAGPDGVNRTKFLNNDTGEHTIGDPRLVPIPFPDGWLFHEWGMEVDDPDYCPLFSNREIGKVVAYDPRMTMCALMDRGVNIRTVNLV